MRVHNFFICLWYCLDEVITVFKDTSKKIKICSIIFFVGSFLNQGLSHVRRWFVLGRPDSLLKDTLEYTVMTVLSYLVIACLIYGFGILVKRFED